MRKSVLISMLMLAALLSGCKREPNPEGPVLTISLEVPAPAMVKATVPASDVENAIHSIKIWVFNSNSTHALVTSLELDASHPAEDFPQAGSVKRYSLPVSWDFALSKPRPTVDVFVLANAAAIGLDQTLWAEKTNAHEVSSYDEVNGALFGDGSGAATNYFSPALKVNGELPKGSSSAAKSLHSACPPSPWSAAYPRSASFSPRCSPWPTLRSRRPSG